METTILITLICLTFILFLTGVGSANKRARLILVTLGLVSFLSTTAYQWSVKSFIDESLFIPLFIWLQSTLWGAMLLSHVFLRIQAGKLILAVNDVTQAWRKIGLALIFPALFFLFGAAQSNLIDVTTNPPQPIYDQEFFYQRLPFWVMWTLLIGLTLYFSLYKVGVYERAVIFLSSYIEWSDITSFLAYELDGRERIVIQYKAFSSWKKTASMILIVPKDKKQMLREILLAKNIPEQT